MKKIYHFHIPKTGGRFIYTSTIHFLNYDCQLNNIDPRFVLRSQHSGWNNIDDDTYLYTTIRNPIERLVSHYVFYNVDIWHENPEDIKNQLLNKLKSSELDYLCNYQSKIICSEDTDLEEKTDNYFEYDFSKLDERINRINFKIKTNEISSLNVTKIYNDSCAWLGIEPFQKEPINISIKQNVFTNQKSKEVLQLLSQDDIDYLIEMNNVDWNLYNTFSSDSINP